MLTQLLFVCVEVLRPSQPSGVMSSEITLKVDDKLHKGTCGLLI